MRGLGLAIVKDLQAGQALNMLYQGGAGLNGARAGRSYICLLQCKKTLYILIKVLYYLLNAGY